MGVFDSHCSVKNSVDDDNEYGYHGHEYTLYDRAARSGGYDSDDYDGGYSKSDDSHGYGNKLRLPYYVSVPLLIALNRSMITRKLNYRKDDRAMRPMYGCPEKFRESLSTPTATFPEIFNELLFRLSSQVK